MIISTAHKLSKGEVYKHNSGCECFRCSGKTWNKSVKGLHLNPDTEFKKGIHYSCETEIKKGQNLSPKTQYKKGGISWSESNKELMPKKDKHWNWKGGKPKCILCEKQLGSYKARHCVKCASKLFHSGEKNNNWRGGKSFEPYSVDWKESLKKAIRERDHYICFLCHKYGNNVHHIDYDKKNCNLNNLITLCHDCHLDTNVSRENWIVFFNRELGGKI
jgi:hypothetical protein